MTAENNRLGRILIVLLEHYQGSPYFGALNLKDLCIILKASASDQNGDEMFPNHKALALFFALLFQVTP
jgi:hypothetical protein